MLSKARQSPEIVMKYMYLHILSRNETFRRGLSICRLAIRRAFIHSSVGELFPTFVLEVHLKS